MKTVLKKLLAAVFLALAVLTVSCKKEDPKASDPSASPSIATYSGRFELADLISKKNDPACFVDLVTGKVYKASEAAAHAAEIDMVWTAWTANFSYKSLYSPSSEYITPDSDQDTWDASNLFAGWSKRNDTKIIGPDNPQQGSINFNDITNAAQFDAFTDELVVIPSLGGVDFHATTSQVNHVYWFDVTHNGEKYYTLMYIPKADFANGWADFVIKVKKTN